MLEFHAVTTERWEDLALLFRSHGNPNYCWCQLWRLPSAAYSSMRSGERRECLQDSVAAGTPVGILAYQDGRPLGWCSVAPRQTYTRIENSSKFPRLDDKRTWAIVCMFLAPEIRGQKLTAKFLRAAVKYAKSQGAEVVEGYPVEPHRDDAGNWQPAKIYTYMGYTSTYLKAGFKDVTPAGAPRRIMRHE